MTDTSPARRSGTLYWLPVILGNQSLDPTEALLLIGLADHVNAADECYVGITTLATYARVSYGTARRRLAALEQRGVIHRTPRHRDDGGRSVYDYRLDRDVLDPPINLRGGVRAPGSAEGPARQDARAEPPRVEPPRRNNPPAPDGAAVGALFVVADAPEPDRFDEFWKVYPLRRGKPAARKAWDAAVRSASAEEIIAGAARYASERAGQDPSKTKYPQGWLADRRWEDDPLPTAGPANQRRVDQDRQAPGGRLAL